EPLSRPSRLNTSLGPGRRVSSSRATQDNTWLNDLDTAFMTLKESGKPNISGRELVEDRPLPVKRWFGWRSQLVEPFAAARYFGKALKIEGSDHITIAKPGSKDALQHQLLRRFIDEMEIAASVGSKVREPPEVDTLAALVAQHPILAAAQSEIESTGLSNALAASILCSEISPIDLADFYLIMARRVSGQKLYGLAYSALELIDKFNIGHSVVEYCLEREPNWKNQIAKNMVHMRSEPAVLWCHKQLTTRLKYHDTDYYLFLDKHISKLAEKDLQTIVAYLLHPDRGPAHHNIDSLYLAIKDLKDPSSFVLRWREWIRDGRFDNNGNKGDQDAELLYFYLSEAAQDARFTPILDELHRHVHRLLKSEVAKGLYHLRCMLEREYHYADEVFSNSFPNRERASTEEMDLYRHLHLAFDALVEFRQSAGTNEKYGKHEHFKSLVREALKKEIGMQENK
ncbi:hypothetical protein Q3C01_26715, partial [Bradyrhizobium sp. UFLA05-109]